MSLCSVIVTCGLLLGMAAAAFAAPSPECELADPRVLELRSASYRELEAQTPLQADAPESVSRAYHGGDDIYLTVGLNARRAPGAPPLTAGMARPVIPGLATFAFTIEVTDAGNGSPVVCAGRVEGGGQARWVFRFQGAGAQHRRVLVKPVTPLPEGVNIVLNAQSSYKTAAQMFAQQCRVVDARVLKKNFVATPIEHIELGPSHACRARIHVRTPYDVAIRVTGGMLAGKATVRAGFKPPNGYVPFVPQCEAAWAGAGADKVYLAGLQPDLPVLGAGAPQLWAIDAELGSCKKGDTVRVEVSELVPLIKTANRGEPPQILGKAPYLGDLRLSCFSDNQSDFFVNSFRRNRGAAALTKPFLDLRVVKRFGETGDEERAAIEQAALYAVSAWTRACLHCGPETLSLASVNGRLFATSLLVERLDGTWAPNPELASGAISDQVAAEWAERLSKHAGLNVAAFMPLNDAQSAKLCKSEILKQVMGEGAACVDGRLRAEEGAAILRLILTDGTTSCDNDLNTVACEQNGQQVELNTRDYRYVARGATPDAAAPGVGRGKKSIDLGLVLAHEIGHWLGLGHYSTPDALMSESLDYARCISDADVNALMRRNADASVAMPGRSALKFKKP